MSIASEITRLQGVKSDILQAIADKGVTVPSDSMLDDCPDLIADISGGDIAIPFEFYQGGRGTPDTTQGWPNTIETDSYRICSQVIYAPIGSVIMLQSSLLMGVVDGVANSGNYNSYAWYNKIAFIVKYGTITIAFKNSISGPITPLDGDGNYVIHEFPQLQQ